MVTIVITAYNVEDWIAKAIESACRQTFDNLEIIVVEDCSTDSTREFLSTIDDSKVKIVYNVENLGAGASRRKGIEAANGEYILLLDGDDWIEENFIEELYDKAVQEDADIVSGGITIIHKDGSKESTSYGNCITEGDEKFTRFRGEKIVFMNNKLIRRRLHEKVPYCVRRFIEDTPVIIPMMHLANKVAYIDNTGYNYRMHEKSLTHSASDFKYALFRALCAEDIIRFFEKHDKGILERLPFAEAYSKCIYDIKECNPTAEMIAPYKEEWIEFTTKLIGRIGGD